MECHGEQVDQWNLQFKSDVGLRAMPLFHTEHADCSCQLSDCLGPHLPSEEQWSSPESGEGQAQAPSHYKQNHAQVVLWEWMGYGSKGKSPAAKVEGRTDRWSYTGSCSLKVTHRLFIAESRPLAMKWSQRWWQAALWMTQLLYLEVHSWPDILTGLERVA